MVWKVHAPQYSLPNVSISASAPHKDDADWHQLHRKCCSLFGSLSSCDSNRLLYMESSKKSNWTWWSSICDYFPIFQSVLDYAHNSHAYKRNWVNVYDSCFLLLSKLEKQILNQHGHIDFPYFVRFHDEKHFASWLATFACNQSYSRRLFDPFYHQRVVCCPSNTFRLRVDGYCGIRLRKVGVYRL